MPPSEAPLIVDLVMSSLSINSTGVSTSGRVLKSIVTPASLDPTEILEKWVLKHVPDLTFRSSHDRLKMLSLIACFSPVPRAVQLMVSILKSMPDHTTFDAVKIKYLYKSTIQEFRDMYPGLDQAELPVELGKALLFNESTFLDGEVMEAIENSMFVNTISIFRPKQRSSIFPKSSILSMNLLRTDGKYLQFQKIIVDTIDLLLEDLLNAKSIQDAGNSMEIMMRGLISARLQVLVDLNGLKSMTDDKASIFRYAESEQISQTGELFSLDSLLQVQCSTSLRMSKKLFKILSAPSFVVQHGLSSSYSLPRSNYYDKNKGNIQFLFVTYSNSTLILLLIFNFYQIWTSMRP